MGLEIGTPLFSHFSTNPENKKVTLFPFYFDSKSSSNVCLELYFIGLLFYLAVYAYLGGVVENYQGFDSMWICFYFLILYRTHVSKIRFLWLIKCSKW